MCEGSCLCVCVCVCVCVCSAMPPPPLFTLRLSSVGFSIDWLDLNCWIQQVMVHAGITRAKEVEQGKILSLSSDHFIASLCHSCPYSQCSFYKNHKCHVCLHDLSKEQNNFQIFKVQMKPMYCIYQRNNESSLKLKMFLYIDIVVISFS